MKLFPAIDLKDNRCVRLTQGKEEMLTVFNDNPVEQALFFENEGCERLHLVDLDGAFGRKNINKETIIKIREKTNLKIELGGGIKSEDDVSFWLKKGINYFIIGSLAMQDVNTAKKIIKKYENKIYIALDVFKKKIMIKGWVESSKSDIEDVFNHYNDSSVRGFVFTDISRDGMLEGLNIELITDMLKNSKKKIIVGGGLSSYEDLEKLKMIDSRLLEGVIAGKSFYSGKIEIKKSLKILNANA